MARKAFSIHSDYYGELKNLTAEQRGMLLLALINWASDDTPIELDSMCAMLFRMMTAQIERISKINSANGSNGGRGNKSRESEQTEDNQIKPSVSNAVSDTLSVPNTASKSNNNIDNEADKTISVYNPDKTGHGKHGLVLLSADELSELTRIYREDKVSKGIEAVDGWAYRRGNISSGIDWQGQIVKAITEWKPISRMQGVKSQQGMIKSCEDEYGDF